MNKTVTVNPPTLLPKILPIVIIGIIVLIILRSCFVIIDPGYVGVKAFLGNVSDKALPAGFHFVVPFADKVEQIDIRQQKETAKATAASADLQTVSTQIDVQYSLVGDIVPKVFQRVGRREVFAKTIIDPAIQECLKAVTARYTAEQLVTQRSQVKVDVEKILIEFIQKSLTQKELTNCVDIHNLAITDFKFSPEFDRAIEDKVRAEQEALKAKREKEKLITEAEGQKEKARLEAEARAISIEAEADARALAITAESKARAEAIRLEAEALKNNPELIQLRTIEQWNGQLPRVNGSEVVPFLNIGGGELLK